MCITMMMFAGQPEANTMAKPSFELILDSPCYFAGDVVTGTVTRRSGFAGLISPRSIVNVKVFGGTKIHVEGDHRRNHHTADRNWDLRLFQDEFILHDGPVHIPPGPDQEPVSWPFSIPLPLNPGPIQGLTRDQYEASYLPLSPEHTATHDLPFSFGNPYETSCPALVAYQLVAEILEERHGHRDKGPPLITSTFVEVRPAPSPPIIDSNFKHFERRRLLRSERLASPPSPAALLPQQPKESFFKKLFSTSSPPPCCLFNIQINYPTIIQLDSINPIPFLARIVSLRPEEVNEPPNILNNMISNPGHSFHLTSLKIKLKSTTQVSVPGERQHPVHEETFGELSLRWDPERDGSSDSDSNHLSRAPVLPDCSNRAEEEGSQPIPPMMDLGALIDWRVSPREMRYQGENNPGGIGRKKLYPDFVTYNIRHRHVLRWEVGITMAKETFKVVHEDAVEVVSSCSWS
ncbi:hypothetical protein V8F06_004242 [Rhypophila decipiens]